MRLTFSGFALALLIMLGATEAHAYDCSSVPSSVTGDLIITEAGDCTISHDVTVTDGSIQITAGGSINAQALTTNGGNILLQAQGDVATNDITTTDGTNTAGIEIDANLGGGNDLFTIGGSGQTNGINGTVNTASTTGGGTNTDFIVGGLYVTNGTSDSTGGITVTDMSKISVQASASRSGNIILDAKDGTITFPTGTLNTNGATGSGAGVITLMANTVTTVDGTVLGAAQDNTATGTYHGVIVAAQTINVAGTNGLAIHADGNGVSGASSSAYVYLLPEGAISVSSNGEPDYLLWTTDFSNIFYTDGGMTVAGSSAPITATANGNDAAVTVSGYPINFNNGPVTLQSKGATDHQVLVEYFGTFTGASGLAFSGTGDVVIDASGDGGNGGLVQIYTDQANISTTSFTAKANGPSTGNGNGGQINFQPSQVTIDSNFALQANGASAGTGSGGNVYSEMSSEAVSGSNFSVQANGASGGSGDGGTVTVEVYPGTFTLDESTTASIQANASSDGTGNAQPAAVTFSPGAADFNVGFGAGQIAFSARGGSTGGNGGGLYVEGYSSAVTVYGAGAMSSPLDVSAPGAAGNGGQIYLTAYSGLTFDGDASVLTADSGSTSGNGGLIQIQTSINPLVIGTGGDGDVTLTATGQGNGNGGTVSVLSYSGITADATCISVDSAGDGTGGTITLNAGYSGLTLDGDLDASSEGMGNGTGGQIGLTGGYIYLADDVNTTLTANGNGSGDGGSISVTTNFGDVTVSGDEDALSLEAMSTGSGNGGSLTVNAAGNAELDGTYVTVTPGPDGDGNGGNISISSTSGAITATDTLDANAIGAGTGGTITFNSASALDLSEASLSANGGDDEGEAGEISLTYASSSDLNVQDLSATSGTDTGGSITVTNTADADLNLDISGTLSTDDLSDQFAGSLTLTVSDDESNAINVSIGSDADFSTIVSGSASSVSILALSDATIGLNNLTANTGNICVSADGSGSCTIAAVAAAKGSEPRDSGPLTHSVIGFDFGPVHALNGDVLISGQHLQTLPAVTDTNIIIPGVTNSTTLVTEQLDLGANTYILGNASPTTTTTIEAYPDDALTINVASGSTAGIKSAANINIQSSLALEINPSDPSDPMATLSLEASGTASISSTTVVDSSFVQIGTISGGSASSVGTPNVLYVNGSEVSVSTLVSLSGTYISSSDALTAASQYVGNSSTGGPLSVTSGGDMTISGTWTEHGNGITIDSGGTFDSSAGILSIGGPTSIQSAATLNLNSGSVEANGGDISVFVDTSLTTGTAGGVPANVDTTTQVSESGGGVVNWGDTPTKVAHVNVTSGGTQMFTAAGQNINFDANLGPIGIKDFVTFFAH